MEIESIETVYKDIPFRSRLEARWAIFWDTLKVPYEYEPKKFDFGEIRYIPDFWLPNQQKWVEIKGQMPNDIEIKKAQLLAQETQNDVAILSGLVRFDTFSCNYCEGSHYITIPSGVGITYFWGKKGTMNHVHMQIDEFNFIFLEREVKTNDLHVAFADIHLAFRMALAHKFPPVETNSSFTRKDIEKLFEEFSQGDSGNNFETDL
jgi:hypothetical protein